MEKFVSPEKPPEGIDRELLTILAEECCEVGQRVSKALRFGVNEVQPGQPLTNAQRIAEELGDLSCVASILQQRGLLDGARMRVACAHKHKKLDRFLQSVPEEGQ